MFYLIFFAPFDLFLLLTLFCLGFRLVCLFCFASLCFFGLFLVLFRLVLFAFVSFRFVSFRFVSFR